VKRILNVNDQPALRKIATRILSEAGYHILEASSGEEALAITRTDHPDLVLLDVRMEGMDGFEVCRQLRADASTAYLPIIFMSGHHVKPDDQTRGHDLGADAYLTLPLDKESLLSTVARFF
jgi:CheY-like chemotaxis protein